MLTIIKKLLYLFNDKEKKHLVFLSFLIFVGMLLEVLSIGLIVPLVSLINEPDYISKIKIIKKMFDFLGQPTREIFLLYCTLILVCVFIIKNVLLAFIQYMQFRFFYNKHANIATRLLSKYMYNDYTFHLSHNSALLIRNINNEVGTLIGGILIPSVTLIAEILILVGITCLIIYADPLSALITFTLLGIGLGFLYRFFKHRIEDWGNRVQYHVGKMILYIQQGLGGIKEIKVVGKEAYFEDRFRDESHEFARNIRFFQMLNQLPRYTSEVAVVFGLFVIFLCFYYQGKNIEQLVPFLALYAAAAFRLMPCLNRVLTNFNTIKFSIPALNVIHTDLSNLNFSLDQICKNSSKLELKIDQKISINDLYFKYPESDTYALKGINLNINKGEFIGIAGQSGCGKTTLVDLILGILKPSDGSIFVGGTNIQNNIREWQNHIAYIPQNIFLCDDTIRSNVALGIHLEEVDENMVWEALRSARLDDYVRRLPKGLDTVVGERGVRLSGGQCQRIGIARALYFNTPLLVMDEATAALDQQTESEIMDIISSLKGQKTLIIIAHRLATLKVCERILLFDKGFLVNDGDFDLIRNLAESGTELDRKAASIF